MKKTKAQFFAALLLAGEPALPKDGYQYPELLVVPRASQRLATEANNEAKAGFRTHFILQAPAFMTLIAGASATTMKEAKSKETGAIAAGVGLGWLVATLGLSSVYTPYRTGQAEVGPMSEKSREQSLAKERRAEEALAFPAYIMRRVQYISAFTNFAASIAIAGLPEENEKIKALGGVAAAVALLPLIFDHPWIATYEQQQDYKKKIYGPVAQLTLLPQAQSWTPGLELSFRF